MIDFILLWKEKSLIKMITGDFGNEFSYHVLELLTKTIRSIRLHCPTYKNEDDPPTFRVVSYYFLCFPFAILTTLDVTDN